MQKMKEEMMDQDTRHKYWERLPAASEDKRAGRTNSAS